MHDKFLAIVNKLDELRKGCNKDVLDNPPSHLTEEQWAYIVDGIKMGLALAKVTIIEMATDRFEEK